MKIKSIECLKLARAPAKPAAAPRTVSGGRNNPQPIHRYPEILGGSNPNPGEAFFTKTFFVRVTAADGTWGLGSNHWGEYAQPVVDLHLAPLLTGRDCMATEYLNDLMWRSFQRMGFGGIQAAAQGAVDIALWDLKGKLLGAPVYSLLGGPARPELDLYVTTNDIDWAMELGFTRFKVGNFVQLTDGLDGINRLEEFIAAAREKIGPDAELMLNSVMGYNVEYAIRILERLRPYNLAWFEEPLMPWDHEGHARLKAAVPTVPIATGETHRGRHAFRELIGRGGVDIVQPDIAWTGGITETLKIYALAEAAGLQTIPHVGAGRAEGQHMSLALPEVTLAEYTLRSPRGTVLADAPRAPGLAAPVGGKLKLSDAPGLGLEYRAEDFAPFA